MRARTVTKYRYPTNSNVRVPHDELCRLFREQSDPTLDVWCHSPDVVRPVTTVLACLALLLIRWAMMAALDHRLRLYQRFVDSLSALHHPFRNGSRFSPSSYSEPR